MSQRPSRGLIVVTRVARLPDGRRAGFWLPQAAYAWRALCAAGWDFSFASTRDGEPAAGGVDRSDPPQRWFLDDPLVRARLRRTVTADRLDPRRFGAVFVAGGHGAMFDLPGDDRVAAFVSLLHAAGGVVTAIGQGVAALLGARLPDGRPLVAGRRLTACSDAEEEALGLTAAVPFALPAELRRRGAAYQDGEAFRAHVVIDGTLVTAQNSASARRAARAGVELAAGRRLPDDWLLRAPR